MDQYSSRKYKELVRFRFLNFVFVTSQCKPLNWNAWNVVNIFKTNSCNKIKLSVMEFASQDKPIFVNFRSLTIKSKNPKFMTSEIVTSQNWNLKFQIGQVFQNFVYYIFAIYLHYKFFIFKTEKLFKVFILPANGHVRSNHSNQNLKKRLYPIPYMCVNLNTILQIQPKIQAQELIHVTKSTSKLFGRF